MTRTVVVAAAVVRDAGRILITRRLEGTHLAGTWEFPGGKCEPGEDHAGCLRRELREELGVDASVGGRMLSAAHDYPDRRIEIHFYECALRGMPVPQLGQEMRWVDPRDLGGLEFPPADAELIAMLGQDERRA